MSLFWDFIGLSFTLLTFYAFYEDFGTDGLEFTALLADFWLLLEFLSIILILLLRKLTLFAYFNTSLSKTGLLDNGFGILGFFNFII